MNSYVHFFLQYRDQIYSQELMAAAYSDSTNNGTHWTAVNNGLTNIYVYSLTISGTNIFAGTSGGGLFSLNKLRQHMDCG